MPTSTIRLHRVLRCPPAHVYRAFIDPAAHCKWSAPHGFVATSLHADPRVGGSYRMSFTNFRTGQSHAFGGTYRELTPPTDTAAGRIRYTDTFDAPGLPGEMNITVTFTPVSCGTDLTITQEGVPEQIPAEMCYLGWQESLNQLAALVEPEIP